MLTCIALILPIGSASAADNVKNEKPLIIEIITTSKNIIHEDVEMDILNTEGEILNIKQTKNGIVANIKDIVISIDDKSEIINGKGEKVSFKK